MKQEIKSTFGQLSGQLSTDDFVNYRQLIVGYQGRFLSVYKTERCSIIDHMEKLRLTKKSLVSERGGIPWLKDIWGIQLLTSRLVEREVSSQIIITITLENAPAGTEIALENKEALPL